MNYKEAYLQAMDNEGIMYTDIDEFHVSVSYSGDNVSNIEVHLFFDQDGDGLVALRCWSFGRVPDDKRAAVLEVCNSLNFEYRWVKFYIENDGEVACAIDGVIDIDTVGQECIQLVSRMVGVFDEVYPRLMKAVWA